MNHEDLTHEEIISHLSCLIDKPATDILYSISMQQVIQQIVQRMGDDALSLSQEDLELAREEVMAVINHSLDYRPYIDEGLDVWQITRKF